ncbi:MAG: hypothetical protein H6827_00105 [Planctomycetes bacterium]|nr:hypothetical protein [Planctomycetota bacterium]
MTPLLIGFMALIGLCSASAIGLLFWLYRRQTLLKTEIRPQLEALNTKRLGPYYTSLKKKLPVRFPRDKDHACLTQNPVTGRSFFNPIATAHAAHAHYEVYLQRNEPEHRAEFLRYAQALRVKAESGREGGLVLPFTDVHYLGQQIPWLSAMAQGHAIMVWLRAWEETKAEVWLGSAEAAAVPFTRDVADGGVRCEDVYGVFYEEYAFKESGKQRHTLNGMMSSLMGLHDLWKVTGKEQYRGLFMTGVNTLRKCLTMYQFPFCTAYDLRHLQGQLPIMQAHYHAVHVAHLTILHAMTGDPYLLAVAEAWKTMLASRYNRLCLFLHYVNAKRCDMKGDAALLGGALPALRNNIRRALSFRRV